MLPFSLVSMARQGALERQTGTAAEGLRQFVLLKEARTLLAQAGSRAVGFQARGRKQGATVRLGAIDKAAAGLPPMLLHDFREWRPDVTVKLTEDKTIRLLPRLITGRLDIVLVRPPEKPDRRFEFLFLLHETALVANRPVMDVTDGGAWCSICSARGVQYEQATARWPRLAVHAI